MHVETRFGRARLGASVALLTDQVLWLGSCGSRKNQLDRAIATSMPCISAAHTDNIHIGILMMLTASGSFFFLPLDTGNVLQLGIDFWGSICHSDHPWIGKTKGCELKPYPLTPYGPGGSQVPTAHLCLGPLIPIVKIGPCNVNPITWSCRTAYGCKATPHQAAGRAGLLQVNIFYFSYQGSFMETRYDHEIGEN